MSGEKSMFKKMLMTSLLSFSSFVFAQELPPVLSVDVNTELKGKKLELLEVKQNKEIKEVKEDIVKPPVSLPKSVEQKNDLKNDEKLVQGSDVSNKIDPGFKSDMDNINSVISTFSKSLEKNNGESVFNNFNENFGAFFSDQIFISKKEGVVEFFDKINKSSTATFGGIVLEEKFNVNFAKSGASANIFGRGVEKYKMQDQFFEIPISWSANLEKVGEEWKILSFHSGANFINNDILKSYEEYGTKMFVVGGFAGAFVGLIIGLLLLMVRKKK